MDTNDRNALDTLMATAGGRGALRIRHFIYIPDRTSAEALADNLRRDGFEVETRMGADEVNWLVLVHHLLIPDEEAIERLREQFTKVAEAIGGEYDGWEAEA